MVLTSSQICNMLFTEVGDGAYKRTSCEKQYKKGNGYTNLLNHLKRNDDNYEHEAQEAARRQNRLHLYLVSSRRRDLYRWIEWVVCVRLPLAFIERRFTHQNASLSLVSEDMLSRYITLLSELLEVRAASELSDSVGLVLDGWMSSSRHYLAIFAVFDSSTDGVGANDRGGEGDYYDGLDCSSRRFVLLAFLPVEDEEGLSAQSQSDVITDTLSGYDKPWSTVKFMVVDNCFVNQYISREEGAIPLIGCASRRFNLAVKDFLKTEEALIAEVQALMTMLRTLKGRAVYAGSPNLRFCYGTTPGGQNAFSPQFRLGTIFRFDVLRPRRRFELHQTLIQISVPIYLDQGLKEYLALKTCLVPTAPIVDNPHLELGLVKLQRGEALSAAEKPACAEFRSVSLESAPAREDPSNSIVKAAFKKPRVAKRSHYEDVSYVPPTSNECERFFSATKLVLTDLSKSLSPSKLEMLMFLQYNRKMWDIYMVEELRARIGRNSAD